MVYYVSFGSMIMQVVCVFLSMLYDVSSMDPDVVDLLTPLKEMAEACGYEHIKHANFEQPHVEEDSQMVKEPQNKMNESSDVGKPPTALQPQTPIASPEPTEQTASPPSTTRSGRQIKSCPDVQPGVMNVHIVPHTHLELGYTASFDEHFTGDDEFFSPTQINVKRILDFTISELYVKPHRRFTLANTAYLFHWWSNRDETVRRMVYQLIRQGRLTFVGGGWSISDEATTVYHAIIDHYTFALRKLNATFLSCGRPLVAWQSDVMGHSREFTSLLALMGFDGLFINPISYDDEMARMRRKGLEFVWRGSDDLGSETDLFTHKLFDGYWSPPGFCFGGQCSDPLLITSSKTFENIEERVEEFKKIVRFRQGPYYRTNNIMVMMGQRDGYYDASVWFANIDRLIASVNRREKSINVLYSNPACYLKAVYESNPKLQTKQDDFFPFGYDKDSYGTGLYSTRPSIKYMAREGHIYLQIAKHIQVIARLGNNDKIFEEFNWINGAFQDHTIITGQSRDYVVSYYKARMTRGIKLVVDNVLQKGFNKLRKNPYDTNMIKCRFNVSRCHCTDGPHMFIVLYNPLAWPVTMPVRLPMFNRKQVVYDPQGNHIPAGLMKIPEPVWKLPERNSSASFELVFIAENIPPLGIRSYFLRRHQLGWLRPTRSLIKKIKNKPKKYLVRQTNTNDDISNDIEEYEYFDDVEVNKTSQPETKIQFGQVNRKANDDNDVVTPRNRVSFTTTTEYRPTEATITTDGIDTIRYRVANEEASNQLETTTKEFKTQETSTTMIDDVVTRTPLPDDVEMKYWERYECYKVEHSYIRNRYVRVNMDKSKNIVNISLANGIRLNFNIQMFYYVSDDPSKAKGANSEKIDKFSPGAYILRTMDEQAEVIKEDLETIVYKNNIVQEIHCRFSSWASIAIRLYKDNPVLEVDWLVGPIPIDDGLGKEVMMRYVTNLDNKGVFYTDSNGRQTMKRIRNTRPTFEHANKDPIAGNLYPVTSKIYIEDLHKNVRFAVLNDRSQAGSSLKDGEITLLLHRRILTDDCGGQAFLNETYNKEDTVIRGQHYIYISKSDHKPYRIFEKKLAKEIQLKPQILTSPPWGYGINTKYTWMAQNNEYTALKSKLPLGVHILSLEQWDSGTLLLRLENYLEKSDVQQTGVKKILLKELFTFIVIKNVKEAMLAGNIWLKEWVQLAWNKGKLFESYNEAYGGNKFEYAKDEPKVFVEVNVHVPVELKPQQIRTFVVWFEYK